MQHYLVQSFSDCEGRVVGEPALLAREGALVGDLTVPLGFSDA